MDPEVARLVTAAEVSAERTIAQVRMAVALLLAVVFSTTVLPLAPRGAELFARQVALASGTMLGYFLLGMLSFWLAPRLVRSPWLAWLFVTGDALLILSGVAISLSNSGLPPSYFPVFPLIWLVPLVLSTGALRYDPRLQAYLTALLVLGMAMATLWSGPPLVEGAPAAHNPLTFFMALPPNLIRTAMVASVGGILVLAALRARRLLARAITETRAHEALGRFLPPQIAHHLASGGLEPLKCGTRHAVSVLFVDIRGFTGMTETMSPAGVTELIGEFRRIVLRVADAHGGVIDKFIGDGAMLLFGVPKPTADAARRAVRFSFALAEEIDRWNAARREGGNPPVEIGIGAHCGLVFCGIVGGPDRLEFTVLGDAVNVAARLEQLTKELPHRLVASGALLEASCEPPDPTLWTPLPHQALRGRAGTIDLFAALPRPG